MKFSKRILAIFLCLALILPLLPASALAAEDEAFTLTNGYIEASVSRRNGGFLVKTAEGNLLKKSDNNKDLLYHSGNYDTSFVSFRVGDGADAKDYLFGGKYSGSSAVSVTQEAAGSPIVAEWTVDGITFTQTVTLAEEKASEHGMVSIALAAKNLSGSAKHIQARILYDTCLGGQDFAYYQVNGGGLTDTRYTEQMITDAESLRSFYAVDDTADPLVTAYVVSEPTKAAVGHWNNLAASLFDFAPNANMNFTNAINDYLTADSACALYYDLGSVESGEVKTSVSNYGVYSNHTVSLENSVAVNTVAPLRLNLNEEKNDYVPLVQNGLADFSVVVSAENYESETAKDLENLILAVRTTKNLRALDETGQPLTGHDFGDTEPVEVPYTRLDVNQTITKTLYFEARPLVGASYERVTVGMYKDAVTNENLLGEKVVYILLPGSDGDIPKVTFMSMTPDTIYFSGTRHLYVAVTNDEFLANSLENGNCAFKVYSADGKTSYGVPTDNITITDGVADIALTEDIKLAIGGWYLQLEWSEEAVTNKLVAREFQNQTSTALNFLVSSDPKFKNDCYGVLAAVKYDKGTANTPDYYYRLENFKDEAAFSAFEKDKTKYKEILLVFRGEFTADNRYLIKDENGKEKSALYYTAVSKKSVDPQTRENKVDNLITINNCLDFENGTMSIYFEDYKSSVDFAQNSPILVEFDGDLYTSDARTSVWKGKAGLTKLEQGKDFTLIHYDKNGKRKALGAKQQPITLIWPNVFGLAQTLAGLALKFAYGQFGVMEKDGTELGRTIAFAASLSLSFMSSPDDNDQDEGTASYFGRMKELWSDWRGASIYQYAYHGERFNKLTTLNMNDSDKSGDNDKGVQASVMVPDILFGCGQGFVGLNFSVKLGVKNLIDSLPSIQGTLSINTINDWSFGLEGNCKLSNNLKMEASLKFKSYNDIPIPDELYFYVGGFKPGINIDGAGVVWLTGGGGGFSNLYDTIFCTSGLPPLKLILKVGFSIMQVLEGEAKLQLALTGIDLTASNLKILGTIECIKKIQLGLQWYPDLKLQAGIYVSMFEQCIEGQGYIILIGENYSKWFFEMFIKAALKIPASVPLVGGMTLLGAELGVSTKKIWGAFEALGLGIGITYYWGEDSVHFGSAKDKAQPTYPNLLLQGSDSKGEDFPIAYDAEHDRTLYARIGTNFETPQAATILTDSALATMDSATRSVASRPNKTSHKFNLGEYAAGNASVLQISYAADSYETAKTIASGFKVTENEDGTGSSIALSFTQPVAPRDDNESLEAYESRISGKVETNKSANANVSFDEQTQTATVGLSITDSDKFAKDWWLSTGSAEADVFLYNVLPLPKMTSVNTSTGSLTAGNQCSVSWSGERLDELDSIKFFLVESTDPNDGAGYALGELEDSETGTSSGSKNFTIPADVPAGNYYLRAVYSKDEQVNGIIHSSETYQISNGKQPDSPHDVSVSASGDLKYSVTIPDANAANTTGYFATVYNEDGSATDITDFNVEKAESGDTSFEVGGSYIDKDGNKAGLVGGKSYIIGITPYNAIDTSSDGEPDTIVYGVEHKTSPILLPVASAPTAAVSVGGKTLTAMSGASAASAPEATLFTTNTLAVAASFSEAVTGTWALDGSSLWAKADSDNSVVKGNFNNTSSVEFTLAAKDLAEGDHVLSFVGKASDGDSFAASYPFTVDTQAPRLLISSPLSGSSFGADGKVTITGVTDSDALLSVTVDGVTQLDGKTVKAAGGELDTDGLFSVTVPVTDADAAATHSIVISAKDASGNATEPQTIIIAHPGLGKIKDIAIKVDDSIPSDGNLSTKNEGSAQLSLVGVTEAGKAFVMSPDCVVWNSLTAEGSASITSEGKLIWTQEAKGFVQAMLEVTDGAFRTASLTLGAAEGRGYVSVSATTGGTVTGGGQYQPGDDVTLTATPNSGYRFDHWEIEGLDTTGLDLKSAVISFKAQEAEVSAKAVFVSTSGRHGGDSSSDNDKKEEKSEAGAPSAPLTNGTLSFSRHTLAPTQKPETCVAYYVDENGNTVILPLAIAEDGELLVLAPEGVEVKYMDKPVSFSDTAGHWAESSMNWAASHGLFNGVGDGKFDPNGKMTRAMFVTVLYRIAGSPKTSGKTDFADLKADSWYENAVTWAVANGIVNGVSATAFAPDANITREQMCSLVARFLTALGYPVAEGEGVKFKDEASVSSWAADDVAFCQRTGIINGKPDGSFDPKANATRAENAAVMERMIESILTSLSEAE